MLTPAPTTRCTCVSPGLPASPLRCSRRPEYRMHGENMIRNSGLMLRSDITVLRSQRRYIERDRRREAAWKVGLEYARRHWGDPLVERVREQVGEGEWKEALRGAYLLARYYPRGIALVINDKPLLERRLEIREKEVRGKEGSLGS